MFLNFNLSPSGNRNNAPHLGMLPRPLPSMQVPEMLGGGRHGDRGDRTFVRSTGHPPGGAVCYSDGGGGAPRRPPQPQELPSPQGGSPKSPEESRRLLNSLTYTLDIMSGILKKSITEGRHDDIINNVNIMFFS